MIAGVNPNVGARVIPIASRNGNLVVSASVNPIVRASVNSIVSPSLNRFASPIVNPIASPTMNPMMNPGGTILEASELILNRFLVDVGIIH